MSVMAAKVFLSFAVTSKCKNHLFDFGIAVSKL